MAVGALYTALYTGAPSARGDCTGSGSINDPDLTSSNLISVMNARTSASVSLLPARYLCLERMSSILSRVSKTSLQPRCTASLLCITCLEELLMAGDKVPCFAGEGGESVKQGGATQCLSDIPTGNRLQYLRYS